MIRIAKIFLWGLLLLLLITGNSCNYPDTATVVNLELTQTQSNDTLYQLTKRFFLLFPTDTALLSGIRICTTITNNDTSFNDDSIYFRTITLHPTYMWINNTKHLVFPQMYQLGTSFNTLAQSTVVRYFEMQDTAILQRAYEENGILYHVDKNRQKVIPITVEVGYFDTLESSNNKWPASPLIQNPITVTQGTVWFTGYSVATKALAANWGENYIVNGHTYQFGIRIKTYYSISSSAVEGNESVSILGTLIVTRSYFKDIGLVEQDIASEIYRKFANGTEIIKREFITLERGPEGAKIYNDWEIPDSLFIR